MAKKLTKSKKVEGRIFESSREDKSLLLDTSFIYEVEIYKSLPNSFNLEDSKFISSKTYTSDISERFKKEGISFKRTVTLIAAPESWLKENSYVEKLQKGEP